MADNKKYLDYDGLGTLVTQINNKFAKKTTATTTTDGLMSAADKEKLDGIDVNANKYTLPTASTSNIGGIKIGKDNSNYSVTTAVSNISKDITSGKYYAVEIDKNDKAFVYVPWTDTNTKVKQTVKDDDNVNYPILLGPNGGTSGTSYEAYYDSGVTLNPSTNTIAANISGNAATAATADTANTAITSTNLAGGAAGSIPYQTAAGTTAMLAKGNSGQVLKINSSGLPYWAADSNSDVKVKQTVKDDDVNYPILLGPSGGTSGTAYESYYDSGVTLNPSTNTIEANISGNAGTANTATNLAGGAAGSIPYQTDDGTTAMLAKGTNGQVLKLVNGLPAWSSDNDSDTKVKQNLITSTASASYPLLLAPSGQTATTTGQSHFASGVTLNPSTNTITANISGSASTANTATTATTATHLANGAKGSIPYQTAAGTTAMLAKGSSGQVLKINSSGVPHWADDLNTTYSVATTTTDGLMSASDKTRLDALANAMRFVGVTTTSLTENSTTKPIKIDNADYTQEKGDVVVKGNKEFVWDGSKWKEIGDTTAVSASITNLTNTVNSHTESINTLNTNLTAVSGRVETLEDFVNNHVGHEAISTADITALFNNL